MNEAETALVLAHIKGAYPSHFRQMTKQEALGIVKTWQRSFTDDDGNMVLNAVDLYIQRDLKGMPPSIGQVRGALNELMSGDNTDDGAAWAMVYRAICNSAWHSNEEFAKLPPILQRVVGSPRQLQDWGQMEASTISSVVMSNVLKQYRASVDAENRSRSASAMLSGKHIGNEPKRITDENKVYKHDA